MALERDRIAPRPRGRESNPRPGVLPSAGRVGYLSDEPVNVRPGVLAADRWGTWLYQEAQYSLAPIVLVVGETGTDVVLANLKDAAKLDEIARAHRLRVAERFENGAVALLRR